MTMQTIYGPKGNCYAACIATIMKISLQEIPDLWGRELVEWCYDHNWKLRFSYTNGLPLNQQIVPLGYVIASQCCLDNNVHAVVLLDGQIVHDPSPRPFGNPRWPVLLWSIFRRI